MDVLGSRGACWWLIQLILAHLLEGSETAELVFPWWAPEEVPSLQMKEIWI